ncbi:hypothetical protein [Streptomyces genisteinicus]|uniref:Uncharacterized protein n=1 Tax=Streptomyces genisteinicus TaxID=2768068 RepID=A0A7H0HMA5_9ACTN|nr:hypothetical protein [Streptomyces genisteinicus]QNP61671.1 hypothetical protein IAG43_01180 [Streptomyces genisteinicus]
MSAAAVVGAAGIAVVVAGVAALVVIVRSGPVVPDTARPVCGECGHWPSEHSARGGRCLVATGGSGDRYDGGGNWTGWWRPEHCGCSGYRERRRTR